MLGKYDWSHERTKKANMGKTPDCIILDGMSGRPMAITFPFSIGGYSITTPSEWMWFVNKFNEIGDFDNYNVMKEALEQVASGSCCQTPDCCIDEPYCDAMVARAALKKAKDVPTARKDDESVLYKCPFCGSNDYGAETHDIDWAIYLCSNCGERTQINMKFVNWEKP
jgi:hypothetical protein